MRTLGAVVAGYVIFAASAVLFFQLAGEDPHASGTAVFMTFSVVYGILFASLAGYVAAVIARRADLVAAVLVAVVIALGAVGSLVMTMRSGGAIWTQVTAALILAPSALGGGWLRLRQLRKAPR